MRALRERAGPVLGSEFAVAAAITLLAAGLRLWRLDSVPLGLHGDEAWTGLDARRVVEEGWIGPYALSALGQPIGPVYWTAGFFAVLPDTTFVLRLSMAVFGVATIPLAYVTFRVMFDRTVGAFASFLLAVMMWHLHLSRTAFMVQVQPFVELAALLVLVLALRRRSLWLYGAAGVITGAGVYAYNSYLLFLPVPLIAIVFALIRDGQDGNRLGFGIIGLALLVTAGVVAALPMIEYVDDHTFEWRYHQKVVNVTDQESWKDASFFGKGEILGERAWEWQRGLVWGDRYDLGDGLATEGHPPVEPLVYGLAIIGLSAAIWNWRRVENVILIAAVAFLPWGALLTIDDGLFRRTLGLAPFIAVLAAIPLAWAWNRVLEDRIRFWPAFLAIVLVIPAGAAVKTTRDYFGPVQNSFVVRFIYPYQLDAASTYIDGLPPGTEVYFYSDRWSFDYETRLFLAPTARGIDRSIEFGRPRNRQDFSADRSTDVAFVFLGTYLADFDTAVLAHPGGVETSAEREGELLYRAYFLPRQE